MSSLKPGGSIHALIVAECERQGITLPWIIGKLRVKAESATKVSHFANAGIVVESREDPDHATQIAALDRLVEIQALRPRDQLAQAQAAQATAETGTGQGPLSLSLVLHGVGGGGGTASTIDAGLRVDLGVLPTRPAGGQASEDQDGEDG